MNTMSLKVLLAHIAGKLAKSSRVMPKRFKCQFKEPPTDKTWDTLHFNKGWSLLSMFQLKSSWQNNFLKKLTGHLYFFLTLFYFLTLQYCIGFAIYQKWIRHRYTCVTHPEPQSRFDAWYWWPRLKMVVAQSCLTLCNPMDCNPPDSSAHGIV